MAMAGKLRRFPAGNGHGWKITALSSREWRWLKSYGAFLQGMAMAEKLWRFPTGNGHGWKVMALSCTEWSWLENYGAFPQEKVIPPGLLARLVPNDVAPPAPAVEFVQNRDFFRPVIHCVY
jgi:DNA-binding helix-hairpin-helix protein with protein kinase domain